MWDMQNYEALLCYQLTENIINVKIKKKELELSFNSQKDVLFSMLDEDIQDEVSTHFDEILKRVNRKMFHKLSRLVTNHVKSCNFVNASKVEFTELEFAILNLGPKHVFRDTFGVPDLVSYFEKAAYILKVNGENSPIVNSTLELLKEEHMCH